MPNQSPKPTLESVAALRGWFSGSAACRNLEAFILHMDTNNKTRIKRNITNAVTK